MNQETGWYDNTDNLYPIPYSEPEISSYSIRLSYSAMDDLRWASWTGTTNTSVGIRHGSKGV